jgi:hypothetical protein
MYLRIFLALAVDEEVSKHPCGAFDRSASGSGLALPGQGKSSSGTAATCIAHVTKL